MIGATWIPPSWACPARRVSGGVEDRRSVNRGLPGAWVANDDLHRLTYFRVQVLRMPQPCGRGGTDSASPKSGPTATAKDE